MTGRRLLFVADSLDVGGAERALVGLAAGLVRRGDQVTVGCSVGGALSLEAEQSGVVVRVLGDRLVKRRVDRGFARAVGALIAREAPDLVHTHMFASAAAVTLAGNDGAVPLVVHEHSEAGWRDAQARHVAAAAYRRSAAVIAASTTIKRRLIEVDEVPEEKVHLLTNAVPVLPSRTPTMRLPRPRAGPLVGVVARLQPEKGVTVFLYAAALVRAALPGADFVVIGDGPERSQLEALAAELELPVTFLGFRLDAPGLLKQLDLLVVPSFSEGTPLVVVEAAAAGVPVVATSVGGIPEQVRDEVEALLVPPGDPSRLAEACLRVLREPALGARLASAARDRQQRLADPEATVEAVDALYRRILGGPVTRGPQPTRRPQETLSPQPTPGSRAP